MAMTQEERDSEDAKWEEECPMREWEEEIVQKDFASRDIENILAVLTSEQLQALDPETKAKFDYKQEVRARKST